MVFGNLIPGNGLTDATRRQLGVFLLLFSVVGRRGTRGRLDVSWLPCYAYRLVHLGRGKYFPDTDFKEREGSE